MRLPRPDAPPLRFGVIGCADIAWRRTLPALIAAPGVQLVAVASRDEAKAVRFAARFGCAGVPGYDSLLGDPGIDAVYIPLPPMLHDVWVRQALLAGKHVLVEKPLADGYESTAQLLQLARSQGLVLMENMTFPHHSQHVAVRKLLADGAIGELRDFSSVFTIPPLPAGDIRYQPEVGGGALLDLGIYPIRAALHFLGPGVEVTRAVLRCQGTADVVVSGRILACTHQGVTADLFFGMEHSYQSKYEIAGSSGRLILDRAFTPPPVFQPVIRIERQDHREEMTLPVDDQFANTVALFARAVRTGEGADACAEASLRQARLVAAAAENALRISI